MAKEGSSKDIFSNKTNGKERDMGQPIREDHKKPTNHYKREGYGEALTWRKGLGERQVKIGG